MFELPSGRLSESAKPNDDNKTSQDKTGYTAKFYNGQRQQSSEQIQPAKPIAASRAKLALIETYRDVALEDVEFAKRVLPLLQNYAFSRQMERQACLVAVTRIIATFPQLTETKLLEPDQCKKLKIKTDIKFKN